MMDLTKHRCGLCGELGHRYMEADYALRRHIKKSQDVGNDLMTLRYCQKRPADRKIFGSLRRVSCIRIVPARKPKGPQQELICLVCSQPFMTPPSEILIGRAFCSRKCFYALPKKKNEGERFSAGIPSNSLITDCWEWQGCRNKSGYGVFFGVGKKRWLAHRRMWAYYHGAIATDLCVLHRCDNPPCVNLNHLFVGDRKANAVDSMLKGRHWRHKRADKSN